MVDSNPETARPAPGPTRPRRGRRSGNITAVLGLPPLPKKNSQMFESAQECRDVIAVVRANASAQLADPEHPKIRVSVAGMDVEAVRCGPEVWRGCGGWWWIGPSTESLGPSSVADVLAFRCPDRSCTDRDPLHLALELRDGSCIYWSYWAVASNPETIRSKLWHSAMRNAVQPEIDAYYAARKAEAGGAPLRCEEEGCGWTEPADPSQRERLVVHHQTPFFCDILRSFCLAQGWLRGDGKVGAAFDVRLAEPGDPAALHVHVPIAIDLLPAGTTESWEEFHRDHPKELRLLCYDCNHKPKNRPPRGKTGFYQIGGRMVPGGPFAPIPPPVRTFRVQWQGKDGATTVSSEGGYAPEPGDIDHPPHMSAHLEHSPPPAL